MELEYILISAAITINSFILLFASLLSYRRYKNKKLLFVIIAFSFFFTRGLLLSLSLFFEQFSVIQSGYYIWVIDIIILNTLYLASLKR